MQLGLLFETLSNPRPGTYVQQLVGSLHEPIDIARLLSAWEQVVARHEILRTSFDVSGATPTQRVGSRVDVPFEVHDWSGRPRARVEAAWEDLLRVDRDAGFALGAGAPWRLAICRLAADEHQMLFTYHHALLDGRSRLVLLRELFAVYRALGNGDQPDLEPRRPFRDFIAALDDRDRAGAEGFWHELLGGLSAATPLPAAAPHAGSGAPGVQSLRLGADMSAAVHALAARETLTLGTVLQGAWALLIAQETRRDDVVFGATRAGRRSLPFDARSIVGLMMTTVPVRVSIEHGRPLSEWLAGIRAQSLAVRPFEHTPLIDIQRATAIPANEPLFETLLSFESDSMNSALRRHGSEWERRDFQLVERLGYGLSLTAYEEETLLLKLHFDGARVGEDEARRLLARYGDLLEEFAAHPDVPVGDLGLLHGAVRGRVLEDWGRGAELPRPLEPVPNRIAAQATRRPEACAAEFGARRITYRELDERANRVARHLHEHAVQPGALVGLALPRGLEMVVAVLGIWRAGAAYLPLDPAYPSKRLEFILDDAAVTAVVTTPDLADQVPSGDDRRMLLMEPAIWADDRDSSPLAGIGFDGLAYVIYTSGSTGVPKGVMIDHSNVAALVEWASAEFSAEELARVLASTSLNFDLSVFELFVTLSLGHTVVVVENLLALAQGADPEPSLLNSVPSVVAELLARRDLPPSVRTITLAGETLPRSLAERLLDQPHTRRVVNLYGPCEDTTFSTGADCVAGEHGPPPIGRPFPGTRAYILDARQKPVAPGVVGELYLGGAGVARGYLARPELTRERFIESPLSELGEDRLYGTGDLVRWRQDGVLEFHGRADNQVKVRGFRIEPGEVEAALSAHERVRDAAVVAAGTDGETRRIIAYVVGSGGPAPMAGELRSHLRATLPEHMIPSAFVELSALPLTENGKLDRRALPEPVGPVGDPAAGTHSPREQELAELWRDVLGLTELPRRDADFFDLGGNSFLALRLLAEVEARFGKRLPIAAIVRAATVAGLSEEIEATSPSDLAEATAISAGGRRPPWFCIQTDRRGMLALRNFVEPLGADQPIYGLQAADPTGGVWKARSIGDIALRCVDAIRAVQPEGPYFLSGHSLGGLVAYDVACRLESSGERVQLMLLDTVAPSVFRLRQRMRVHLAGLADLSHLERAREIGRLGLRGLRRLARTHGREKSRSSVALERGFEGIIDMQEARRLRSAYRPERLRGRLLLFVTQRSIDLAGADDLGWAKLVEGGTEAVAVPGDHLSMLIEPDVRALAHELAIRLGDPEDKSQAILDRVAG